MSIFFLGFFDFFLNEVFFFYFYNNMYYNLKWYNVNIMIIYIIYKDMY